MSDLLLNLDTALPPAAKRNSEGNWKHRRFIKRRHFLESKGFLKQKQLPAQAPLPKWGKSGEPGRDKKWQKVDKQNDGAGKQGNTTWEGGSTRRHRALPKENSSQGAKDFPAHPPSGVPAASSGASARHNRTQANCSTGKVQKSSLLSEYESGLPSAQAAMPSKMVAIDCEMVGTGPGGRNNDLARCSIINYYGDVMYDEYIRPVNPITNYRTRWSGIRRCHMTNAVPFTVAQKEILRILSGKIVVGHAIHNDFKALKYFHPKSLTRDTSKIPLLNRKAGFPETKSASLKRLTKQLLHRDIQVGSSGHSSVEDAQATMELYKVIEVEWERHLATSPDQD
ncbi:interferon-stimulated 20 kDa exonuclease-like 2 [Tiliqua scincoides]|uniref:interferon-stimulated 20 kDa exonuclease-like 2 n=1 Tax=Tiliqua scincoides TaxID=71010 RepID=UPI003462C2F8